MSLKDFKVIKVLGKGAFGRVDLVERKEDGKIYGMKCVKISALNTKEQENALNEVRVLASISHPNIIGYKEAFFDEESRTLNIVMEYADDGDIEAKIQSHIKNKTNFSENDIWSYLIQMIEGLKALHDIKTMHRDLKSANVFLMKNGLLKLGDLNVSKVVKNKLVYTQTGTPYYASPEVWADRPYDYKSDIWSIGCVLYELCTLKPPFRGNNLEQLYKNVTKGVFDPIPSIYSSDLSKIVALLLQTNPNNRPNCDMILSNPIILKRMDYNKNFGYGGNNQLLNTIKLPRNMSEINQKLPKTKKYVEPSGLTINKKTEEPSVKTINLGEEPSNHHNPLLNDYSNRRIISGNNNINPSINLNVKNYNDPESLKKVPVRPSSAKIEPRSRTPGVIISSGASNIRSNIVSGVNRPSSGYSGVSNSNPISIQPSNNRLLKPSPSSNYISPISASKNVVSTGVSSSIQKSDIQTNISKQVRASSARPISRIPVSSSIQKPSSIPSTNIMRNDKSSMSPGRVLSNPNNLNSNNNNNMNININVNNINILHNNVNNIQNKMPYEYKSPYKTPTNNPVQIMRPSSSRDKIQASYSNNHVLSNNKPKTDVDHKMLIQPVKIMDTPQKRLISANIHGGSNINNVNPNNFLKNGRPSTGDNSGMVKIIQNNQPKLINLYRK